MSRSVEERVRDVRAVVDAARRLARRGAELAPEIARTSGLSPEGALLALGEHLELDPTDDDLTALVARAGDSPRVHVILSANVFVAALRAIAIARAASSVVTVRPSRRDPVFARALVAEIGADAIRLGEDVTPADVDRGEIHVYGRDETIARVRADARAGVRVLGHGAGMGIAWIGPRDPIADAARALARDVVPFDQRGCLSPRIALVCGDAARAADFARALHEELGRAAVRVPRGPLEPDEAGEARRWMDTFAYAGEVLAAPDHAVAVAPPRSPLAVPPPGRHVHIASVPDERAAAALLAPLARAIVALGANDPLETPLLAPSHVRLSPLGSMQRPPLDGPVDGRVLHLYG